MGLRDFSRGAGAATGGRFGGGGNQPAPAQNAGGRFGRQQQQELDNNEPEDEGAEVDETPQREPARGGGRFGGRAPSGGSGGARNGSAGNARGRDRQGNGGGRGGDSRGRASGKSRFLGLRSRPESPDFLEEGDHDVQVIKTYEAESPASGVTYCYAVLRILSSTTIDTSKDQERRILFATTGQRARYALPELFEFCRACMGYEDDDQYKLEMGGGDADLGDDVAATLMNAACSDANAEQELDPQGEPWGENPLEDAKLFIKSTKGNLVEGVQYYRYKFAPPF